MDLKEKRRRKGGRTYLGYSAKDKDRTKMGKTGDALTKYEKADLLSKEKRLARKGKEGRLNGICPWLLLRHLAERTRRVELERNAS